MKPKILLRRINGFVDFNPPWNEYHAGFGFLSQDFWIGTEKLSYLTNQKNYELRIDMTYSDGTSCHADYNLFRIGDGFGKFKIVSLGQFLETLVSTTNIIFEELPTDNIVLV